MSTTQAQGKIVQCIGAVVDVEFPRDHNGADALNDLALGLGGRHGSFL